MTRQHKVFMTGIGVSTECGLSIFRFSSANSIRVKWNILVIFFLLAGNMRR